MYLAFNKDSVIWLISEASSSHSSSLSLYHSLNSNWKIISVEIIVFFSPLELFVFLLVDCSCKPFKFTYNQAQLALATWNSQIKRSFYIVNESNSRFTVLNYSYFIFSIMYNTKTLNVESIEERKFIYMTQSIQ